MSSAKVKVRRHSFSSLEEITKLKKIVEVDCALGKEELLLSRKRKALPGAEDGEMLCSDSKRPAVSLVDVVGNMQEVVSRVGEKEADSLCCLPGDPMKWTEDHVSQWLKWAEKEFGFNIINHSNFKLTGAQLCSLTKDEIFKRAPPYTGDILTTHLNLLRVRSVALSKLEDSVLMNNGEGGTLAGSPGFSMGWSPYLWPSSIADIQSLSNFPKKLSPSQENAFLPHLRTPGIMFPSSQLLANPQALSSLQFPLQNTNTQNHVKDTPALKQLSLDWNAYSTMLGLGSRATPTYTSDPPTLPPPLPSSSSFTPSTPGPHSNSSPLVQSVGVLTPQHHLTIADIMKLSGGNAGGGGNNSIATITVPSQASTPGSNYSSHPLFTSSSSSSVSSPLQYPTSASSPRSRSNNEGASNVSVSSSHPPFSLVPARTLEDPSVMPGSTSSSPYTTQQGQTQLWQFLYELLQDEHHSNIISWVGNEGEFKLLDPEAVSMLWGVRKRKPNMNYDKLSRAIRYYYDKKIMHKVQGKRYVYKFNFDTISKHVINGVNSPMVNGGRAVSDGGGVPRLALLTASLDEDEEKGKEMMEESSHSSSTKAAAEREIISMVLPSGLTVQEMLDSLKKDNQNIDPSLLTLSTSLSPLSFPLPLSSTPSPTSSSSLLERTPHISQLTSVVTDTPISFLPPAFSLLPQQGGGVGGAGGSSPSPLITSLPNGMMISTGSLNKPQRN